VLSGDEENNQVMNTILYNRPKAGEGEVKFYAMGCSGRRNRGESTIGAMGVYESGGFRRFEVKVG